MKRGGPYNPCGSSKPCLDLETSYPTVEEGELAIVGDGSYESALPTGGDPLGWGHEIEMGESRVGRFPRLCLP